MDQAGQSNGRQSDRLREMQDYHSKLREARIVRQAAAMVVVPRGTPHRRGVARPRKPRWIVVGSACIDTDTATSY
jgi:hypothetical protein